MNDPHIFIAHWTALQPLAIKACSDRDNYKILTLAHTQQNKQVIPNTVDLYSLELQWHVSILDTFGTAPSVLTREVSLFSQLHSSVHITTYIIFTAHIPLGPSTDSGKFAI